MERVIKRLLLHNNREDDEIKESDFDELKQDVQMIRYDVMNGLKSTKEDALKYVKMFHNGISLLGDFLFETKADDNLLSDFANYKLHEKKLEEELEVIQNPSKALALAKQKELKKNQKNSETQSQNSETNPNEQIDSLETEEVGSGEMGPELEEEQKENNVPSQQEGFENMENVNELIETILGEEENAIGDAEPNEPIDENAIVADSDVQYINKGDSVLVIIDVNENAE